MPEMADSGNLFNANYFYNLIWAREKKQIIKRYKESMSWAVTKDSQESSIPGHCRVWHTEVCCNPSST